MAFIYRYRIGFILAFIKFLLPFILQDPMYELHRDEMLYLEQGNHLAWGFMEVPPLLSILLSYHYYAVAVSFGLNSGLRLLVRLMFFWFVKWQQKWVEKPLLNLLQDYV